MFHEITQNAQPSPNAELVRGLFIAIDRWLHAEWHRDEGTFETLHHDTLVKSVVLNLRRRCVWRLPCASTECVCLTRPGRWLASQSLPQVWLTGRKATWR
jgi:hypothetical protein